MNKINIAIIGATGYTGSELVSILSRHPNANLVQITSESRAGERFSDVHPAFQGICDQRLVKSEDLETANIQVAFLALPHRISMEYVARWKNESFKMIDLSGDYRLSNATVYQEWYGKEHVTPGLVPDVPYGLPELNREAIREATLVANPGCYPTASTLALAPLAAADLIDPKQVIIDAKSGTTGAGVKSKPTNHFSNVNDNFKAYGIKTHRHTVEIEESLSRLKGGKMLIQFTPHLLPVDRGILATCYASQTREVNEEKLIQLYRDYYEDEPFIRIRENAPELKHVRGTNLCDIFVTYDDRTNRVIAVSAIDNLVKGAAGQAVHNMNLMFSIDETAGLNLVPLQP